MKTVLLLALILHTSLAAQEGNKGVTPAASETSLQTRTTRAVVVGISDYLDPKIPDLQDADKDARAFGDWLRSRGGGSVPEENIRLLLNAQATNAEIIMGIQWLMEESKKGDKAIIYLSGYWDVEQIIKKNAFFFGYDSSPTFYMGSAFRLKDLKDMVGVMSEKGVSVLLISDAFRSEKLAGSKFGDSQITAPQSAAQFKNEMLLSPCRSECRFGRIDNQECCSEVHLISGWGYGLNAWPAYSKGEYGVADSLIQQYPKASVELAGIIEDMLLWIAIADQTDYVIFVLEKIRLRIPDNAQLNYELARLYIGYKGDYARGLPLLKRAVELDADNNMLLYHLAAACAHLKEEKAALRYLKEAITLGFNDFECMKADSRWEALRNTEAYQKIIGKN